MVTVMCHSRNAIRNLRRKLAKIKMPMKIKPQSVGRKKGNATHRARRVIWASEKEQSQRYKYGI